MFIEPTITWVPSGFSGYIWLDTKIVLKNNYIYNYSHITIISYYIISCDNTILYYNYITITIIFTIRHGPSQHVTTVRQSIRDLSCRLILVLSEIAKMPI